MATKIHPSVLIKDLEKKITSVELALEKARNKQRVEAEKAVSSAQKILDRGLKKLENLLNKAPKLPATKKTPAQVERQNKWKANVADLKQEIAQLKTSQQALKEVVTNIKKNDKTRALIEKEKSLAIKQLTKLKKTTPIKKTTPVKTSATQKTTTAKKPAAPKKSIVSKKPAAPKKKLTVKTPPAKKTAAAKKSTAIKKAPADIKAPITKKKTLATSKAANINQKEKTTAQQEAIKETATPSTQEKTVSQTTPYDTTPLDLATDSMPPQHNEQKNISSVMPFPMSKTAVIEDKEPDEIPPVQITLEESITVDESNTSEEPITADESIDNNVSTQPNDALKAPETLEKEMRSQLFPDDTKKTD